MGAGGRRVGRHLAEDVVGEEGGGGGVGGGHGVGPAGARPEEVGGIGQAGPVEDQHGVAGARVLQAEEVRHAAVAGDRNRAEDGEAVAGGHAREERAGGVAEDGRGARVGDGTLPEDDAGEGNGKNPGEGGVESAVEAARPFVVVELALAVDPEFAGDATDGHREGGVGEQRDEDGAGDAHEEGQFRREPRHRQDREDDAQEHLVLAVVPRAAAGTEEEDQHRHPREGEGGEEAGMAVREEDFGAVRQDREERAAEGGGGGVAGADEMPGVQDVGRSAEEKSEQPEDPGATAAEASVVEERHRYGDGHEEQQRPEERVFQRARREPDAQREEPAVASRLGVAREEPEGDAEDQQVEGLRQGAGGSEGPGGACEEVEAGRDGGEDARLALADHVRGHGSGDRAVGHLEHEPDEDRDAERAAEEAEDVHRRGGRETGAGGKADQGFPDGRRGYAGAVETEGVHQRVRRGAGEGGGADEGAVEHEGEEEERRGDQQPAPPRHRRRGRGRLAGDGNGAGCADGHSGGLPGKAAATDCNRLQSTAIGGGAGVGGGRSDHGTSRRRSWRRAWRSAGNSWTRPRRVSRIWRAAGSWPRAW